MEFLNADDKRYLLRLNCFVHNDIIKEIFEVVEKRFFRSTFRFLKRRSDNVVSIKKKLRKNEILYLSALAYQPKGTTVSVRMNPPDATASQKTLLLFTTLLLSGRKQYLSELAAQLGCTKATVIRLVRNIELSGVAMLETGIEDRKRWYRLKNLQGTTLVEPNHDDGEKTSL